MVLLLNLCFEQKYEKYQRVFFLCKDFLFWVVKFSIYLNIYIEKIILVLPTMVVREHLSATMKQEDHGGPISLT